MSSFSTLIYLALLHVASVNGLAIPDPHSTLSTPSTQPQPTHRLHRRLATGVKVAIGICVPGAVLVVGLGLFILALYPAQKRKLQRQNPGAQIGLAELMNGKVTQQSAPPPYEAGHDGVGNGVDGNGAVPVNAVPKNNESQHGGAPPPTYNVEARHAALAG
jgi:hypothetical protein